MSLINQMLKDLAQRSRPVSNPNMILSGLNTSMAVRAKKNKINYFFIASVIFLLVGMIFFTARKFISHKDNQQTVAYITNISEPISNFPKQSNAKIIEATGNALSINSTDITGITLQSQNEMTSLRLMLSQNPLYRITSNGKNQLTIVLENTHLVANLPQIDTMNSAVKLVRMINQTDGALKIVLQLNAGSELKRLEINEEDHLSEMQIDLSYADSAIHNSLSTDVIEEKQTASIKRINYDTSVDDQYQQAMQVANEGRTREGIELLTKFLLDHPEFSAARKSLAELLIKQGEIDKANSILEIGLQQLPNYSPYTQLKAQILVARGQIKDALNLLETVKPSIEENPEYYAFAAALYQRQNKFSLAEKLYESVLKIQPDNSLWWMGLGVARESLNKNKNAVEAYAKARNTDNLSPELKVYIENRIHALG